MLLLCIHYHQLLLFFFFFFLSFFLSSQTKKTEVDVESSHANVHSSQLCAKASGPVLISQSAVMPFEPSPRWIPDEDGHTGALYNNFSVYILRQQWPSEWCCREQTHGWCLDILSAPYRERMVLHGLWPEYDDLQANTTRTHGYWPIFKRPSFDYKVCYSVGSTAGLPVECSIPKVDRDITSGLDELCSRISIQHRRCQSWMEFRRP